MWDAFADGFRRCVTALLVVLIAAVITGSLGSNTPDDKGTDTTSPVPEQQTVAPGAPHTPRVTAANVGSTKTPALTAPPPTPTTTTTVIAPPTKSSADPTTSSEVPAASTSSSPSTVEQEESPTIAAATTPPAAPVDEKTENDVTPQTDQ